MHFVFKTALYGFNHHIAQFKLSHSYPLRNGSPCGFRVVSAALFASIVWADLSENGENVSLSGLLSHVSVSRARAWDQRNQLSNKGFLITLQIRPTRNQEGGSGSSKDAVGGRHYREKIQLTSHFSFSPQTGIKKVFESLDTVDQLCVWRWLFCLNSTLL